MAATPFGLPSLDKIKVRPQIQHQIKSVKFVHMAVDLSNWYEPELLSRIVHVLMFQEITL